MDTISTPVSASEIPWKISGKIAPAPIGLLYKLGALLNAVAMLLLPGLYLAMVGGLGWFIYAQLAGERPILGRLKSSEDLDTWYFFLLIGGGITLLFMIKPLFARRPKSAPPLEITRSQHPRVFAFIDEICAQVRAPRPRHVFVDLQVNASASFSRSFGSLLRRDLTLTIGLPLVAGLCVREFGGVLAHEFGHFAQGAGMRITYLIRSSNAWFARVVYERDRLDEFLRTASKRIDIRIGIVFYFARIMVWLTRKILWVFMWLGNALSCFMLRQMEFDADYYETQVAGSATFARTAAALRFLGAGWQRAVGFQQESYSACRLVDDLPRFVDLEARRLPVEVREAIVKETATSKTGWFDTHPSDADRVRVAAHARAPGVLAGDGPAGAIFDDFATVARQATVAYYQNQCEINLNGVQLLSLDTVAGEVNARDEAGRALKEFFHGLLTIRTMIFLSPGELRQPPPLERLVEEWRDAYRRHLFAVPDAAKLIEETLSADGVEQRMEQARALLQAGFKLKDGHFGLAKPTAQAAYDAQEEARRTITRRRDDLTAVRTALRERLVAALRTYFLEPMPAGLLPDAPGEIERLVCIVSRFDTFAGNLIHLRNQVAAFDLLLQNMPKDGSTSFYSAARGMGASMIGTTNSLLEAAAGLEYPFDHARGKVLLRDFLVETSSHADESIHAFLRARALVDRFLALYERVTGRLAQLALQAEQNVLAATPQQEPANRMI